MKLFYIISGVCLLLIPLVIVYSKISEDMVIEKNGDVVNMKIVEKPGSCPGTKAKWFMKVEYLGKTYSKQISAAYCDRHQIGDIVPMKYLPKYKTVLFPEESVLPDVIAGLAISLMGLLSIVYGIKKAR